MHLLVIGDAIPFWLHIVAPLLLAFLSLQPCVLVTPMQMLSPIVASCNPVYVANVLASFGIHSLVPATLFVPPTPFLVVCTDRAGFPRGPHHPRPFAVADLLRSGRIRTSDGPVV